MSRQTTAKAIARTRRHGRRDDGRRDEEDGGEGRGSAAVDRGDTDGEGKGATTRTEDEDINWDDAAEGIGVAIERDRRAFATAMMTKEREETEGRHAGGAKPRTARIERATAGHEGETETLPMSLLAATPWRLTHRRSQGRGRIALKSSYKYYPKPENQNTNLQTKR